MSGTEELRTLLADATALHGDVRVRGTATRSVRAAARRRRMSVLGSVGAALAVCVVVTLLALVGGPGPDRQTFTPSGPASLPPGPSLPVVAGGPRDLPNPLEVRPVLAEHPDCPSAGGTTPAAEGPSCYRLDRPWLVLHRLARVEVGPSIAGDGMTVDRRGSLVVAMQPDDQDAFAALTRDSVGQRIALVAGDRVWSAPVLATPIRGGELQLDLPVEVLRQLLDVLGVPVVE